MSKFNKRSDLGNGNVRSLEMATAATVAVGEAVTTETAAGEWKPP